MNKLRVIVCFWIVVIFNRYGGMCWVVGNVVIFNLKILHGILGWVAVRRVRK